VTNLETEFDMWVYDNYEKVILKDGYNGIECFEDDYTFYDAFDRNKLPLPVVNSFLVRLLRY
jgi:hypothetical protein